MKLNNKKVKSLVKILNIILLTLLVGFALLYLNILSFTAIDEFYVGVLISPIVVCILFVSWQYYEFDTSGEGLTLNVKRVGIFSFLSSKDKKVDLPKYKLNSYEIKKGVLNDNLTLFINSKKELNVVKVKLQLSILSSEERNNITSELDKIIQQNQKQIESKVA